MMTLLRSILRTLWLALGWLLLAIGAAWAFAALWFDFPITALRHALAVVFIRGALADLALVRPRWHAKLGGNESNFWEFEVDRPFRDACLMSDIVYACLVKPHREKRRPAAASRSDCDGPAGWVRSS